ncbi:MAG: hypothetical protein HY926_07710 [Elusimicrobia bacterium]|nr:hypothetical protein [Elusimicrobiota bacterium]
MRRRLAALAAALALLAPGPLRAQTPGPFAASDMESARGLVGSMRALSRDISSRPAPVAAGETIPFELLRCGPWGAFCAQAYVKSARIRSYKNDTSPIGTGFKALGPAGKTGQIDGPGGKGNGAYRVVRNDPYHLQMLVRTGYIEGEVTLIRDPATGRTTMRFAGKRWNNDEDDWRPPEDVTKEVVVGYDARKDFGHIRWVEDGEWKEERYWGGAQGKDMTIEFGGGWDHDFQQDP